MTLDYVKIHATQCYLLKHSESGKYLYLAGTIRTGLCLMFRELQGNSPRFHFYIKGYEGSEMNQQSIDYMKVKIEDTVQIRLKTQMKNETNTDPHQYMSFKDNRIKIHSSKEPALDKSKELSEDNPILLTQWLVEGGYVTFEVNYAENKADGKRVFLCYENGVLQKKANEGIPDSSMSGFMFELQEVEEKEEKKTEVNPQQQRGVKRSMPDNDNKEPGRDAKASKTS